MISLEKLKILTRSQKLPKNVGDLGKLIVAKVFEKLPKVQYTAQSGHSGSELVSISIYFTQFQLFTKLSLNTNQIRHESDLMLYFFKQTLRKTNLRNIIPFLRNTTLLFDTFVNKLIKPMGIYTL